MTVPFQFLMENTDQIAEKAALASATLARTVSGKFCNDMGRFEEKLSAYLQIIVFAESSGAALLDRPASTCKKGPFLRLARMTSRGNKAQADALRAAVRASEHRPKNTGDVEMASVTRPAVSFHVQQDLESMIGLSFGRLHQLFARGLAVQWPKQRAEDMQQWGAGRQVFLQTVHGHQTSLMLKPH